MYNWYILQVHSGTEKKVEKELLVQLEKKGLKENVEEILIPSEDVIEMKKGKKVNTERKFFPGYMIMRMVMDDEIWHTVRQIPKVYGFLGGKFLIFPTLKILQLTLNHHLQEKLFSCPLLHHDGVNMLLS